MSNKKVQKFVVYMMVLAMVASSILFGLSMFL
ncbi:stressosome-associated protein Prli42 [Sporosarcina thermotolerans]|uniref:Stressosome-associated protein Prli42 n=1 Tax=Sporosarcina thermotolerans TaxID=633404 RepID=A0AAW9A6T7_9BACL|nr:stressosome-associated protein Prli42 [Sporosarcina thermotolerans]MDW0117286.1 stressosome-associated protein Prli42 [Sporosarcina thermotolerans]